MPARRQTTPQWRQSQSHLASRRAARERRPTPTETRSNAEDETLASPRVWFRRARARARARARVCVRVCVRRAASGDADASLFGVRRGGVCAFARRRRAQPLLARLGLASEDAKLEKMEEVSRTLPLSLLFAVLLCSSLLFSDPLCSSLLCSSLLCLFLSYLLFSVLLISSLVLSSRPVLVLFFASFTSRRRAWRARTRSDRGRGMTWYDMTCRGIMHALGQKTAGGRRCRTNEKKKHVPRDGGRAGCQPSRVVWPCCVCVVCVRRGNAR